MGKKTTEDVMWVGSRDGKYAISWEQFESIANVEYDAGYGGQEVVMDLVVVGHGWWLSRGEYDGSEWWNYNSPPALDPDYRTLHQGKGPARFFMGEYRRSTTTRWQIRRR
jgi:hypothetical protein